MEFKSEKFNNNPEKQNRWNQWLSKVEHIIDGAGFHIDPHIKEAIVAFNVLDIKTNASCGGHIDRGLPYPWIDIDPAGKEILSKEFPNYDEDSKTVKEKGYINLDMIKAADRALYERILSVQSYSKKVRAETKNKISSLLNEFYSSHKSYSDEGKIEVHESPSDFRIELKASRGLGLDKWKVFDEKMKRMPLEEKERFLKNNQEEMAVFTKFLKKKFFE